MGLPSAVSPPFNGNVVWQCTGGFTVVLKTLYSQPGLTELPVVLQDNNCIQLWYNKGLQSNGICDNKFISCKFHSEANSNTLPHEVV